jgi:hypothetical protein
VNDPQRIVVAGDWHGNAGHAVHAIAKGAHLLKPAGEPGLLIQLGDFGIWPGTPGTWYISEILRVCAKTNMRVWFIDGNHEDFTQLENFRDGDAIRWLPRGTRWSWHGRRWLALGGAVSLDKAVRKEGVSWWPQEEITEQQASNVIAGGPAEVMVTHECPAGVVHTFDPPPVWWDDADLARNDVHRERMQRVVDAVEPKFFMHGHLHRCYERNVQFGYGRCRVNGLDMDGTAGNFAVLDVEAMTWV